MASRKRSGHVRLPQQSEIVIGPMAKPGSMPLDPRTATQDPALKPRKRKARKTKR